jgi:uncharacterized protein YcbX
MPKICDLFIYPVKSCAALRMEEALLAPTGFEYDRNWMVVDERGDFLTQRENPRLALVRPSLEGDVLVLEAPGMSRLRVPYETSGEEIEATIFGESYPAYSTGVEANAWFSSYLEGDFKLVRHKAEATRLGGVQYPERDPSPTRFVDNYGILVISQASHEALNRRLPSPIPLNRFRPNVVVSGVGEYEEDYFTTARRGDAALRFVNPCFRCNMTSLDQETGKVSFDPLPILATYRFDEASKGVKFGAYAAVAGGIGQSLRRGDELEIEWSF